MSLSAPPRPFVFLNMSMTADGKIASANRAVTSFGSPRDLQHLYELRTQADAILCGARTVEQSHATLGNGGEKFRRQRLRAGRSEYPLRILVSGSGTLSSQAEIWSHRFSPIIVLITTRARPHLRRLRSLADQVWISGQDEIDFPSILSRLWTEFGVQRLLGEGGGAVNDALFRADVVDELHLTICPLLLGGRSAPTLSDGLGFPTLARAARFQVTRHRRVGQEQFLVLAADRSAADPSTPVQPPPSHRKRGRKG